jgi:hypothetical protein
MVMRLEYSAGERMFVDSDDRRPAADKMGEWLRTFVARGANLFLQPIVDPARRP